MKIDGSMFPQIKKCLRCDNWGTWIGAFCPTCQAKSAIADVDKDADPVRSPLISGVGKDAETVVNEQGGKQSKVEYRFDVLDPKAMFAMCKVLKEGYDKYGDDSNWRRIPVNEHLNHLLIHIYAHLAGDTSDEHLSHAMCRAMFALAVELQ